MHQRRREDTSLPHIRELADGGIEVTALGAFEGALEAEAAPGSADRADRVEEEEKRLLYVALTRARRKLTLSAVAGDALEQERSLLGLLPASFQQALREALEAPGEVAAVEWRGHPLSVLRPAEGRRFQRIVPEGRHLLRLDPLSADADEPPPPVDDEKAAHDVPIPAE